MHCRACERWGEWSTEAITSLQSLLVISLLLWKRTRTAWEEAMCSRQTDREKAWCDSGAQKVSANSQGFGSTAAPLGTGSTSTGLMFCLSGFLLSTGFKTLNVSLWRRGSFRKSHSEHLLGSLLWKILQEGEAFEILSGLVSAPGRLFVGHGGVPVWLQKGFAI